MKWIVILKWLAITLVALSLVERFRITNVLPNIGTFVISTAIAAESRLPPMQKKNKNEVTDLLDKNVEDRGGFESQLEQLKEQGLVGVSSKEGGQYVPEADKGADLESKANQLGKLEQGEAENQGYRIRASESELLGQIQINYNDSQVRMHKQDTDRIASASEELFARLGDKLRDLGVDCRQKKGEVVTEPEMYIHIEQEPQKEVIYDKHLCEFLRNQYSCSDSLTMTCTRRGMRWNPWVSRDIDISGYELISTCKWVFYSKKLRDRHYRLWINPNTAGVKEYFQQAIANKLGVRPEQISTANLTVIPFEMSRANGRPDWPSTGVRKEYMHPSYKFNYQFRDGNEICEQWSEDWTERCALR